MEPVTLSIISGVAFLVYDRYKDRQKKQKEGEAQNPSNFKLPTLSPAQVETFTHVLGGTRHFDKTVSAGMPRLLALRSAVPIDARPVQGISPGARVYRIVALHHSAPVAADILKGAHEAGQTVLASLSSYGLAWGAAEPMVLVVGGPELHQFCPQRGPEGRTGDFAVVHPLPQQVVTSAEPVTDRRDDTPAKTAAPVRRVRVPAPPKEETAAAKAEVISPALPKPKPNGVKPAALADVVEVEAKVVEE